MDGQWLRCVLQALYSPASAELGAALDALTLDAAPAQWQAALPEGLRSRDWPATDQVLQRSFDHLQQQGWRWLAKGDADYPLMLQTLADAPGIIAVRGDLSALDKPALAMVGARNASADGLDNARRFARELAADGFCIISGLALGVDAAAHRGAMESGTTAAVMGTGPDRIYPARHRGLAAQIVEQGGLLMTEFAIGCAPKPYCFPQRNRIVSGLSLATLVIEAGIASGSLITARTALNQGREVFAIPGSIHNPLARGCHKLLRDGANWLESVNDVFESFGDFRHSIDAAQAAQQVQLFDMPPLLMHMTSSINSLDDIAHRSGVPLPQVACELAELELDGWVERVGGGYLPRRRPE